MGEDWRSEAPGGLPMRFRRAARSSLGRRMSVPAAPAARRSNYMLKLALQLHRALGSCSGCREVQLRVGTSEIRLRSPAAGPATRGKPAALRARCSLPAADPGWLLLLVPVVSWQPQMGRAAFVRAGYGARPLDSGPFCCIIRARTPRACRSHARMMVCSYVYCGVCPADSLEGPKHASVCRTNAP